MNQLITKEHLLFLVIGGFSILLTAELAYFVGQIVSDSLIIAKLNPVFIISVKAFVRLVIYILSVFLILKLIVKRKRFNKANLKTLIIGIIVTYAIVQVFQILYGIYGISSLENYSTAAIDYSKYLKENYFILIISSIVYYFQLLLFALIIINYTIKDD
ncbi:hypothetical protein HNV08_00295 [Winogradskyella eckloniae]|uniref:hypothetical protein n=1 Tax=Winogradskyella eckloniae TaxID=1089306 RepID=UPI0015676961|nr:hypothetical protein [Winogradskyella eckloniae]NRD18468.1 hypothetical protein [Winogradskyella eckloniae]